MRRPLMISALLIASAWTPLRAQSTGDSVDKLLTRYENGWAAALVRHDGSYFERMLSPKFVYTEDSTVYTRAQVIASSVDASDTVTDAHNEAMIVHRAGSSTAAVTGWLVVSGHQGGANYVHRYRFTDTWVRMPNGRWQIVAAEDYLLPGA